MNTKEPVQANTHETILILDDDLMMTDGLVAGLERSGRTLITCNDVESAELIVDWLKPSHIVTDVRLSGQFAFEGLDFVRFVKRQSPESRVIVMTGDAPDALQLEAAERGAVAFLQKPFDLSELDAVIELMSPLSRTGSDVWPAVIRMPLLDDVLRSNSLYSVFQPVVDLTTGARIGFEALTRYRSDGPLRNPEVLFQYAEKKHRLCDLEMVCMAHSLRNGSSLPENATIFLNVHPIVFTTCANLPEQLTKSAAHSGVSLDRIVLEITEQGSLGETVRVLEVLRHLREMGVRLALDDVGVAYSHLALIDKIQPSFIKVSQHFGTGFESDATKMKIVRNLLSLAGEFGSQLILEGVESETTVIAAKDMGIKYAQGYYFAKPADASSFVS